MTVTPQRLWLQFRRHKGKVPELILVNHRKMSLIDRSQNWLFFYEVWVKIADIFSGFLLKKKKKKGNHGHIVYTDSTWDFCLSYGSHPIPRSSESCSSLVSSIIYGSDGCDLAVLYGQSPTCIFLWPLPTAKSLIPGPAL